MKKRARTEEEEEEEGEEEGLAPEEIKQRKVKHYALIREQLGLPPQVDGLSFSVQPSSPKLPTPGAMTMLESIANMRIPVAPSPPPAAPPPVTTGEEIKLVRISQRAAVHFNKNNSNNGDVDVSALSQLRQKEVERTREYLRHYNETHPSQHLFLEQEARKFLTLLSQIQEARKQPQPTDVDTKGESLLDGDSDPIHCLYATFTGLGQQDHDYYLQEGELNALVDAILSYISTHNLYFYVGRVQRNHSRDYFSESQEKGLLLNNHFAEFRIRTREGRDIEDTRLHRYENHFIARTIDNSHSLNLSRSAGLNIAAGTFYIKAYSPSPDIRLYRINKITYTAIAHAASHSYWSYRGFNSNSNTLFWDCLFLQKDSAAFRANSFFVNLPTATQGHLLRIHAILVQTTDSRNPKIRIYSVDDTEQPISLVAPPPTSSPIIEPDAPQETRQGGAIFQGAPPTQDAEEHVATKE
jgi:hypothetical protein